MIYFTYLITGLIIVLLFYFCEKKFKRHKHLIYFISIFLVFHNFYYVKSFQKFQAIERVKKVKFLNNNIDNLVKLINNNNKYSAIYKVSGKFNSIDLSKEEFLKLKSKNHELY